MSQPIRLLIVEDDEKYVKLLHKYFAIKTLSRLSLNLEVEHASNLTEAMMKFCTFAPHALLLDLNFPDRPNTPIEWLPDPIADYLAQKPKEHNAGNNFLQWAAQMCMLDNRQVIYPIWVISAMIEDYQAPSHSEGLVLQALDKASIKDTFLPALDEHFTAEGVEFVSAGGVNANFSDDGKVGTITFWGAYTLKDVIHNLHSKHTNAIGEIKTHKDYMRQLETMVMDISMIADTHRAFPDLSIDKHWKRGITPPQKIHVVHNPQQKPDTIKMLLLTLFPQMKDALQNNNIWYNEPDSCVFLTTSLAEAEQQVYSVIA